MNSSSESTDDKSVCSPAFSISHPSVRTFLIWLVLACLLPGVIGAIALFVNEYKAGRAQQQKDTIQTSRALVQAVDYHLLRVQAIAQALSRADSLLSGDFSRFHQYARETLVLAGLSTNLVLRDEYGRQLLNTAIDFNQPLPLEAVPEQVRGVFFTGKPTISEVFIGPVLKRPLISVDVPVVLNDEVVYALGIGILPSHFDGLLKSQNLPKDWVAGVFDSKGTIVGRTHASEEFVGRKANSRLLQAMTESSEGSVPVTTQEGFEVLSFFSRSPVTNWKVSIGIPRAVVEAELMRTLGILSLGVVALFGIALVLARTMGERIARSVQALTVPAVALGEGVAAPVPRVHIKEAQEVASAIGRAARLLQERADEVAEAHRLARFGTWHWDLKTDAINFSDSLREIFGRDVPAFLDMRDSVLPLESWNRFNDGLQETMRSGKGFDVEIQAIHASGDLIWINAKAEIVLNERGDAVALRGMFQDITERKRAADLLLESEEKLRSAALHDSLTGLPNRALVMDFCERMLAAAQRGHGHGALLFIDLDRFKPINDLYGHETGDRVLQEVGKRLAKCTRHEDLVGRLGGDEFVIVLAHLDANRYRAGVVARHVVESISQPFLIDTLELSISPSIGISYFPEHATDVNALIHTADLAMYQAKQSGRANYQFYTRALDQRADEALQLEVRLRKAIRQNGLRLVYQPVIDIRSGRLVGAEALVRLCDNGAEEVGPDRFIPIAESAGLISELGEWVAAEACRQHAAWCSEGLKIGIAINVSPLQFRQRTFAEKLGGIIADTGMDPTCLEIEVTESAVMDNIDEAVEILTRIKSLGVKVALDDFGTGYSSLSSLTSLPLDKLKVDQSFVRRIERDQASRTVTEAIIGLGRSLRLDVHGEGIESEDTLLYLEEHGCNQAQGYWFSRPLPPEEFARWCRQQWGAKARDGAWERVRRLWAPRG